jgi:polyhydroxyalkanoate synthesis regulator phasin
LKRFIYDSFEFGIMNKTQPRVKLSLLLGTIIALGVFSLGINNIPVQALHKEEQALDKFDNLKGFADAVSNGDGPKLLKKDIPLSSMKASKIYDDADKQTQDCINLAAKIGKGLDGKEVVNCVNDVNFYNKQISNSSVPTNTTSPAITSTSADTGTSDTSTPTSDTSTPKSDTSTPTSDTSTPKSDTSTPKSDTSTPKSDTSTPASDASTSSSGDVKENNMINELVKTGKFTENEAKDFVSKTMQTGADGTSTSGSQKTSNADTSTSDTQASDNTQSSSSQDNNANTQSSSSQDNNANTQSSSSQDNNANTQSSSSQDNNNQSSNANANSNKATDYNDLKDLVHSIKNRVVDSDDITLNTFQDSGAYKGADEATQKCIDLAGKIGGKLGDQEIVHCSEDPNFYQNKISSNNNNNPNDNNNANANPNDNNNNPNDNNNNPNDNNNNPNDNNNNNNPDGAGTGN